MTQYNIKLYLSAISLCPFTTLDNVGVRMPKGAVVVTRHTRTTDGDCRTTCCRYHDAYLRSIYRI